jgi:hypothetical protein
MIAGTTEDTCIYTLHNADSNARLHYIRDPVSKTPISAGVEDDQSIEEPYPAVQVTNGS